MRGGARTGDGLFVDCTIAPIIGVQRQRGQSGGREQWRGLHHYAKLTAAAGDHSGGGLEFTECLAGLRLKGQVAQFVDDNLVVQ